MCFRGVLYGSIYRNRCAISCIVYSVLTYCVCTKPNGDTDKLTTCNRNSVPAKCDIWPWNTNKHHNCWYRSVRWCTWPPIDHTSAVSECGIHNC